MIKRAMIAGLNSAGVHVADLHALPGAVGRHLLRAQGYDAGFHVGISSVDPEVVQIGLFEPPGIQITPSLQKEIEKHFTRQELRRASFAEVGEIDYPARAREAYAAGLLATLDVQAIHDRHYRIVLDYGYSAASYVLPLVLAPLGIEAVTTHAFSTDRRGGGEPSLHESIGQAKRLVAAIGADLGVVFDRAAERLYLIDEGAHEVPVDLALLLFVQLIASNGQSGKLALPITITSRADDIVEGSGIEIVRTRASLADLTQAASSGGVIFGGALSGGYVFPAFLPAYDAMASLCNLLELLAPIESPLSELVATLPKPTLVHRQLPCPWAKKGLVMRLLNERFADGNVDLVDGIKVFEERGWVQVLPDPDEPLIHIYAEGRDEEATAELEREARELVTEITSREETLARG